MNKINIRLATPFDKTTINELFIQMIKFVNNQNKKQEIVVDEELFKNGYEEGYLDEFFIDSNKSIIVADLDSKVIGYLAFISYHIENTSYLYLDDFCVDSNYRNRGIGTKLVEWIINYAKENDFDNLKLHVDENNIKALSFYNKSGFIPINLNKGRIEMNKKVLNKRK